MSFETLLEDAVARGIEAGLAAAGATRPAPYPIGVSITEAARLLSVGDDKVRQLLRDGRIRRMDLGDNATPGSRVVISTLSLFELDHAATTDQIAAVVRLDQDAA
jgi:hypothetical protein